MHSFHEYIDKDKSIHNFQYNLYIINFLNWYIVVCANVIKSWIMFDKWLIFIIIKIVIYLKIMKVLSTVFSEIIHFLYWVSF